MPTTEEMIKLRGDFLRYLRGGMDDAEVQAFEERLLGDQAFSDAAATCEQELIDEYSAGEVNDADKAILHTWIEASPRRIQRLRIARSFLAAKAHKAPKGSRMRFVLPIAAMIAGFAVAMWMMMGRNSGGRTNPVPNTVKRNDAPAGAGVVAKNNGVSAPADQVVLVVAERVRGAQHSQMITQNHDSAVTLQVLLPEGASNGPYRVQVANMRQNVIVDERGLKPSVTDGRLYLIVHIRDGALTPGSYEVSLDSNEDSYTSNIAVVPHQIAP